MKRATADHCVVSNRADSTGWDATCLRCGGTHLIRSPVPLRDFARITSAFIALHRDCKATERAP